MTSPETTGPEHGILPGAGLSSEELIDQAVASVRNLVGWHVWPVRQETVTVDATGDHLVFLPTKALRDVLNIEVDGALVDLDAVSWSADGILHFQTAPRGFRKVVATIIHGYDQPDDLVGVVVAMARRAQGTGQQMSVGGISVGATTAPAPMSVEWRTIDRYKLGPMP